MRRVVLLSAAALAVVPGTASASTIFTDTAFAILDQSSGNARGPDVGFNGNATGAFQWQNHQTFDWSFSYDGTNLTFNWGGTVVTQAIDLNHFKAVGFEGVLVNQELESLPDDMKLTVDIGEVGGIDPAALVATFADDFVPFDFSGLDLGKTWTISGTAVADWTGPLGANSPGFQFGFGISTELEAVPEPAAFGLLGLGLVGVGTARRRRRA